MQVQTPPNGTGGRSSIDRLLAKLREAVDAAIADGATIDEITERIRAEGGDCSRSAVGRYAKNMRELIRKQQETYRTIKAWVDALGERPEGSAGLVLIETLQSMVLATMSHLNARDEPASLQELDRLSHILKRVEATEKLRRDRERAAEKAEKTARANQPKGQGGLSPEAVAIIRAEVEGRAPPPSPAPRTVTSAPVAPWNPAEFPTVPVNPGESHSIPDNPDESHLSSANHYESWTEIAPRVYRTSPTSILSLGPERGAGAPAGHALSFLPSSCDVPGTAPSRMAVKVSGSTGPARPRAVAPLPLRRSPPGAPNHRGRSSRHASSR